MTAWRVAALSLVLIGPIPAIADQACTKAESGQFAAALERAEKLTVTATTAIGPNRTFTRWFGRYNAKSGEIVRRNLKAIAAAMRSDKVRAVCNNSGEALCDSDTYAFVDKDDEYLVHLCPSFFAMDTFKELNADSVANGTGTRAGTLVHEISHFTTVADTLDICYTRGKCSEMALTAPLDALINADSYQYFVEDVTYFGTGAQAD